MITISNIRAMLVEETLLYLLRESGYRPVDEDPSDPTLQAGPDGLGVVGRGEVHYPGTMADFWPTPPFASPQRLLLEARFYADSTPLDLPIVRQAAGTLKDVNENWLVGAEPNSAKQRYHYQYALLCPTGFSPEAQRFAFAQDIHLLHLGGLPPLTNLWQAIQRINHNLFKAPNWSSITVALPELRQVLRKILFRHQDERLLRVLVPNLAVRPLMRVVEAAQAIPGLRLGLIGGRLAVPLLPLTGYWPAESPVDRVWIIESQGSSYLLRPTDGADGPIFCFNMPADLFALFVHQGILAEPAAIHLFVAEAELIRVIKFRLAPVI